MDANLKKFNSSFEYVLKEVLGIPGQKGKKSIPKPVDYEAICGWMDKYSNVLLHFRLIFMPKNFKG